LKFVHKDRFKDFETKVYALEEVAQQGSSKKDQELLALMEKTVAEVQQYPGML
jgi:hypothetical protein